MSVKRTYTPQTVFKHMFANGRHVSLHCCLFSRAGVHPVEWNYQSLIPLWTVLRMTATCATVELMCVIMYVTIGR